MMTNDELNIRPRIRPKAPPSLKENVLRAVREQEAAQSAASRKARTMAMRWLSAAAALLVGIVTFALWPKENAQRPPVAEVVAPAPTAEKSAAAPQNKTESPSEKRNLASVSQKIVSEPRILASASLKLASEPKNLASASQKIASEPKIARKAAQGASLQAEKPENAVPEPLETPMLAASTPTPRAEETSTLSATETPTELTPYEQKLLAELEKKRPLVNAFLAEEMAQANFNQRKIRQIQQESIREYLNLQQTVRQQIRESIENIGRQPENRVREV